MTTQAISARISGKEMGKVFTGTSTDGQWNYNMTDSLSGQQLGILMPGAMIDNVSVVYTAGAAAWRIQDAQTLAVKRVGWASKTGFNDFEKSAIQPYRVGPNDQLVIYPMAVNATSGDSANLAWVRTNKGTELFDVTTTSDNTLTEMTHATNGQTLGDLYFGSTIIGLDFQAEDGATVNSIEIIDNQGGTQFSQNGTVRAQAGAPCVYTNLMMAGLAIQVGKGFALKIATTTA